MLDHVMVLDLLHPPREFLLFCLSKLLNAEPNQTFKQERRNKRNETTNEMTKEFKSTAKPN